MAQSQFSGCGSSLPCRTWPHMEGAGGVSPSCLSGLLGLEDRPAGNAGCQ